MTDAQHEPDDGGLLVCSPFVRVRGYGSGQIDVELPDGGRYWHHVVRLHRSAMLALVDDQDRVLLMWRHQLVPDRWGCEISGRLVDEDEQPADAARRELEETTSYRSGWVEHLVTFHPMGVDAEHIIFVGRNLERVGEPNAVNEITREEWVPLASVPTDRIWRHLGCGSLVALLRLLLTWQARA